MSFEYIKNVVSLKLSEEKCIGCKMCQIVCPHGVFMVEKGKARVVNKDRCIECGACALNCPMEAIEVKRGVG